MSAPRALKPLFGPGSRLLLVDQLVFPRLAAAIARPPRAPTTPSSPSSSICLSCSFTLNHRQVRFLSSSNSKPPNGNSNSNSNSNKDGFPEMPKFEAETTIPLPPPPQPPPPPPPEEDTKSSSSSSSSSSSNSTANFSSTQQAPPSSSDPQQPPQPPPQPPPPSNPDLPSAQNSRRSALNQSLSSFMDRAQTTLFAASQRINDLTGYSGIEELKREISALEASLAAAQSTLHACRAAYKAAVSSRSATQREVTTLLARQKTWTPADFERFTQLYRQDYDLDASVSGAARDLEAAEREAERVARELSARILARYHEEQIWSDKIRRMSTWGTWGLMGVNVLMFLVFQFGAEPWRRQRLVRGFEEKVREALEDERALSVAARREERDIIFSDAERRRAESASERESEAREAAEATAAAAAVAAAAAAVAAEAEEISGGDPRSAPVLAGEGSLPEIVIEEPAAAFWRSLYRRATTSWREFLADPGRWRDALAELTSDRRVSVRMRDLSIVALEGMAAGAVFAGGLAIFFLRRA